MIGTSTFLGYVCLWPHHAGRRVALASSDRGTGHLVRMPYHADVVPVVCRASPGYRRDPRVGGPKGVKPRCGISTSASGAAKAVAVSAVVDECAVVRVVRQDGG